MDHSEVSHSFSKRYRRRTRMKPKGVATTGECASLCMLPSMSTVLWGTLPDELLQLVFARLPLPKILPLRLLSKEWNRSFTSEDSGFMQACVEANPKTFAMIREGDSFGVLAIELYDSKSNRWYSLQQPVREDHIYTMCAGDGGLVCIVSSEVNKRRYPLVIQVLNPLTGQRRALPPNALSKVSQPRMVQLVMNGDTKRYKVIVVGERKQRANQATRMVAEIYCSETGLWSTANAFPDFIFGYQFRWDVNRDYPRYPYLNMAFHGPCVYDCAGRQILEFDIESNPCRELSFIDFVLVKDHLFVLHEEEFESTDSSDDVDERLQFSISEYRYQDQKCKPNWVEVKVHKCEELNQIPTDYDNIRLHACKGLLLLSAGKWEDRRYEDRRYQLTWLYDLSTTKWQAIPVFRSELRNEMFEIRWDAVP